MSAMEPPAPDGRISISLATLRAELTSLELRLVDRLNGALAGKADKQILDQMVTQVSDNRSRIQNLEATALKVDSLFAQRVSEHEKEIARLRAVGSYKKWLWAQTAALVGIAVPLGIYALDRLIG